MSELKNFWISEKATDMGAQNKFIFVVDKRANKTEISRAVSKRFSVNPVKINIQNYDGKRKRHSGIWGRRAGFKKAIITLKKGETIDAS